MHRQSRYRAVESTATYHSLNCWLPCSIVFRSTIRYSRPSLAKSIGRSNSRVVNASNIPTGTPVNITFSGSVGAMSTTGILSGTTASSSATLQVSGLIRSSVTYLFVSATFDVPSSVGSLNEEGPNRVAKLQIRSAPGQESKVSFLKADGTEIDPLMLPRQLVDYFRY